MLKSFCDCCNAETTGSARSFPKVHTKFSPVEISLEISVPNRTHVCEECFGLLLIDAVKSMDSEVANSIVDDSELVGMLRLELEQRSEQLAEKQSELDRTLDVYEERVRVAEDRAAEDAKEISELAAQIKVIQDTAEKRIKAIQAKQAQEFAERVNNPEYVESKERRKK